MKNCYKGILNGLDDAAFLIDINKRVIALNQEAINFIKKNGVTADGESIDSMLKEIFPDFNLDVLLKKLTTANKTKEVFWEDTSDTCYSVNLSSIITDNPGDEETTLVLIKDVTEFKKAKQNEQEFKILVQNQGEGIVTTDINENILFANPAGEEIFGMKGNGLVNHNMKEFVSEDVFQEIKNQTRERVKGAKSSYQIDIKRADGEIRTILVTAAPRFDDQGKFLNSLGIFRDVTGQKKAERDLIKHQEMLRTGLAYQEAISRIALNFNVILNFDQQVNHALKIIGELISVSRVYIFENFENAKSMTNTYEWCNEGIKPQIDELQHLPYAIIPSWKEMLTEKGIILSDNIFDLPADIVKVLQPQEIISIVAFPIQVGGEFFGFIGFDECKKRRNWSKAEVELLRTVAGIITNAYERQIMENNLKKAKDKAEESDRLKSAFLANMSHEIRTPMNGIIGFADLLMNPGLAEEQRSYYAKIVSDSSRQLLSIVTDILDLSRIETGQVKLKSEKISLNGMVMELYRYYKHKISDRSISLFPSTDLDDSASMVYADRNKLYQVLHHLLNNALKFTQKGYVKFGYHANNEMVEFFVKDTGIGIPAQLHKDVFEPFRQAEMEATREYGGTGLGLTISQKLTKLMKGKMWLESDENKGSTFYFSIPYAPVSTTAFSNKQSHQDILDVFDIIKVLVAEDEEMNYIYMEELLSDMGMFVIHARNGQEAVNMCKSDKEIELVLMDIKMPKLNGLDATKVIKEFNPNLTIIAQTAYAMLEDREKALEAGCDDYITKPIDKENLLETLRKHKNGEYR